MIKLVNSRVKQSSILKNYLNADAVEGEEWKKYETFFCKKNCAYKKLAKEKEAETDRIMAEAVMQKAQQVAPEGVDMKQIGLLLGGSMLGLGFLVYMVKR